MDRIPNDETRAIDDKGGLLGRGGFPRHCRPLGLSEPVDDLVAEDGAKLVGASLWALAGVWVLEDAVKGNSQTATTTDG